MQVDDVRLLEFRQAGDVGARVGDIYCEKLVLPEPVGLPDDDAFPQEVPEVAPRLAQRDDGHLVGLFVADQQLGLDAIVFQGFHQAMRGNGCTAYLLGCIDKEYSHAG